MAENDAPICRDYDSLGHTLYAHVKAEASSAVFAAWKLTIRQQRTEGSARDYKKVYG